MSIKHLLVGLGIQVSLSHGCAPFSVDRSRDVRTGRHDVRKRKSEPGTGVLTLGIASQDPFLTPEPPSKEDLNALKKALGFETGSLQYKKRGDGVYLVTYDSETKGRKW